MPRWAASLGLLRDVSQLLADSGGRVTDLVDGTLQLFSADAEVFGPEFHLKFLVHRNVIAKRRRFIRQSTSHGGTSLYGVTRGGRHKSLLRLHGKIDRHDDQEQNHDTGRTEK